MFFTTKMNSSQKIKAEFQVIRLAYENSPPGFSSETHLEISKAIYQATRNFLVEYQDELSPAEKSQVFCEYIELWEEIGGILHIKDTEYGEKYSDSRFGKYSSSYNQYSPMLAGFVLKNLSFKENKHKFFRSDLIFLSVDFEGVNFTKAILPYGHFEHCNFTNSQFSKGNFNQCQFKRCNFPKIDLLNTPLSEGVFMKCYTPDTQFPREDRLFINKCSSQYLTSKQINALMTPKMVYSYPSFLKKLKIKQNCVNAENVAHALWLSGKDTNSIERSKVAFFKWAQGKKLSVTSQAIENNLSKYNIKNG